MKKEGKILVDWIKTAIKEAGEPLFVSALQWEETERDWSLFRDWRIGRLAGGQKSASAN